VDSYIDFRSISRNITNLSFISHFIIPGSILTTSLIGVIILANCDDKILVLVMFAFMMATTDMGFSGYWPTLLYFAPSFAGLLSGLANGMAHLSGFLAPHLVAALVHTVSLNTPRRPSTPSS